MDFFDRNAIHSAVYDVCFTAIGEVGNDPIKGLAWYGKTNHTTIGYGPRVPLWPVIVAVLQQLKILMEDTPHKTDPNIFAHMSDELLTRAIEKIKEFHPPEIDDKQIIDLACKCAKAILKTLGDLSKYRRVYGPIDYVDCLMLLDEAINFSLKSTVMSMLFCMDRLVVEST